MLSAKEHSKILYEAFCTNKENEKELFLVEGLFVDEKRKKVRLTDDNNNGVDFSNEKYIQYKYNFENKIFNVISIFKRTSLKGRFEREIDGNPFIYALKNQNNDPNEWSFDITDEEIYKYIRRFLKICKSIDKEYDTIIMVPSSHVINKRFMDVIFNQVNAEHKIEDMFYKTTKEDAYDSRDLKKIEDYCLKKCNYNTRRAIQLEDNILDDIDSCFDNMPGKYFKASMMNKEYIKFIRRIVTPNKKYTLEKASELIRDKRVLILDDTLSTGTTISACAQNILRYGPAKIDIITLLSNKRKND